MEQKDFVLEMVDQILEILTTLSYSSTRSVHKKASEINVQNPILKRRSRILIDLREQYLTNS